MECNKEEALKAKEIAEKKFAELDISGAKRFALKAQNLNPELDGIPQLIATLDVYISAEKRENGEVDWYRVLGVEPQADESTIRSRYKKLALVVHPDRNKSVGADGAFKILLEAWSLLSDKGKRFLYDKRQNLRCIYGNVFDRKASVPSGENGFHNLSNSSNSNDRDRKGDTSSWHSTASSCPMKASFWTMCNACKMHFEYLKVYLNHNLVCPNCHQPFVACEMPPPPFNGNGTSNPWTSYTQQNSSCQSTVKRKFCAPERRHTSTTNIGLSRFGPDSSKKNFQAGLFSEIGSAESMRALASASAQDAGGIHPAVGKLKRKCETSLDPLREEVIKTSSHVLKKAGGGLNIGSSSASLSTVSKEDKPQKRRRLNDQKVATSVGIGNREVATETMFGSQKGSSGTRRFNIAGNYKLNYTRELSLLEIRNMLMKKAKNVISEKLHEWRMAAVSKIPNEPKEVREKAKGKKEDAKPGVEADTSKCREHVDSKQKEHTKQTPPVKSDANSNADSPDPVSMTVPDPDFYDFDKNRTEKSFASNQVWAAYDEDDGMPRYYAMVHCLISVEPFKMRISWLNFKGNNELAPLNWVSSGFPKTSGDFRVGKHEVYSTLNSFSHQVKWTKGTRGAIQIYPNKGDVWALYRNWSPDWHELTPDEVIHKYDMVELLEDFNEERGVTVAPLVKVAGFKTVFCRHCDTNKIRTIPREEMFRFSHQVPSYLLAGNEGENAPKDCWELDPAATPLELLQVTNKVQKEEMVEIGKKTKEEDSMDCSESPKVKTHIEKGLRQDAKKEVVAKAAIIEKETKEGKWVVYNRRRLKGEKNISMRAKLPTD